MRVEEMFRPLVEFPGYEVGDRGTVRSWKKCKQEWKVLKHIKASCRLAEVGLRVEGRTVVVQVAKLVLIAHIEFKTVSELKHTVVLFKDGDPHNLAAGNLAWALREGPRRPNAKLTAQDVAGVKADLAAGVGVVALARKHRVAENTIRCIAQGKTWANV